MALLGEIVEEFRLLPLLLHANGFRRAIRVLVHNLRFQIGYAIGGFTHAEAHTS